MNLELHNATLDRLAMSRSDLMVDIAVGLYVDRRVTIGEAAEVAEMTQTEFRRFLGQKNVPLQYDLDDFRHDLTVLRERGVD
jgi:predicted HTH domain antitoxin